MKQNLDALLAITAGILVIVFPNILAWVVGIYLILHGVTKLMK